MFKKSSVGKMVQRRGAVAVKTLYRVQVHKITFPKQPKDITIESDVSVCFERGGKIASSRTQKMQLMNDGTVEINFEEALSLVVTMYREDSGKYQEKIGHIVIRQKSKSLLGGEMYKGLGIATFSLDTVANNYRPTDLSLAIKQCSVSGGLAEISVTPKFLGESDGAFDETMSMHSGISDNQINAAEFESIRADSSVADDQFHHQDSMASQTHEYEEMANSYHALREEHDKQRQLFEKLQNDYRLSEERSEEMAEQITTLENEVTKLTNEKKSAAEVSSAAAAGASREQEEALQRSIAEKDDVIQKQILEVTQLTTQIKELENFLEEKTKEISELKENKESQDSEHEALVSRLQSTLSELSDAMAVMNSENGKLVDLNEKFKAELETKNAVIALKDKELHEQTTEIQKYETTQLTFEKEIQQLQQQLQQQKEEYEHQQIDEIEMMRVKYEQQVLELSEQLQQQQQEYSELERQSLTHCEENSQLQLQLTELSEQLHEECQMKSEASSTLLSLQEELSSVTSNLTSSIGIIKTELETEKENHVRALEEMRVSHERELQEREKREEEQKQEILKLQEREEGQQQEILKLQEKLKTMELTNQKLDERLATVLQQEGGLSEEFQKALQENSEMRSLLELTKEEVNELKRERDEVKRTNEELSVRVNELTSSVNDSQKEFQELQSSSAQKLLIVTEELDAVKLEAEVLRADKESLQKEVQELESSCTLQKEELVAVEVQVEELRRQSVGLEEEKRALQKALEEAEKLSQEQEQELQKQQQQQEEEAQAKVQAVQQSESNRVSQLESELLIASEKEKELQETIRKLESEGCTLREEAAEIERKWREVSEELEVTKAVDAERAAEERARGAHECNELMLQMSSLESSHEEKILELNEELKHCQEENLFLHEKLGDALREKKRWEEKSQEQEETYALLQESFQQISLHDEEVNKKYIELMDEFHDFKIQHQSSPSSSSAADGVTSGRVGDGSDVLGGAEEESAGGKRSNDHEVLKLKMITLEEENLYLKNQIKLLEADKEENEVKLESLEEQLRSCQLQLQQISQQPQEQQQEQEQEQTDPEPTASTGDGDAVCDLNTNVETLRCDLEQLQTENEELITQLIETKLQVAYHATETDEERKKLFLMKRKLQLYAERVASLEVTVAERLAMNESSNGASGSGEKKFRWGKKK